jgi:large subunit ribosomal protein L44e
MDRGVYKFCNLKIQFFLTTSRINIGELHPFFYNIQFFSSLNMVFCSRKCNMENDEQLFYFKLPIGGESYMKMQKEFRKFCPKCKTHTIQSVSIYKKGKDRKGAQGALRHAEDKKGYGGQKFPELKRTAKTTKKITLKYSCKICQRKTMKEGRRMRKLEIQA